MSAIFFIDYISLVFQVVINYCVAHGVAPISAENVEAAGGDELENGEVRDE